MEIKHPYCKFVLDKASDNLHKVYHDKLYGFPINDDNELFGRLILEINQAGLSWNTILAKQDNFRAAYNNFQIKVIAQYTSDDFLRLMSNSKIIRNKLKINAVIYNAKQILELQQEFGSFKAWLDTNLGKSKEEWVKLFRKTFKFTGGEITGEFLMSTSYLKGAHDENCTIFADVLKNQPLWIK